MRVTLTERLDDFKKALENLEARVAYQEEDAEEFFEEHILHRLDLEDEPLSDTQRRSIAAAWRAHLKEDYQQSREIIVEATIKTFEVCFECMLKSLRAFLREGNGEDASQSNKEILKDAYKLALIDEQGEDTCIAMLHDRNMASHEYIVSKLPEIAQRIKGYYLPMYAIYQNIYSRSIRSQ